MTYATPLQDMRFMLSHVVDFDAVLETGAFPELSGDLIDAILEEGGKFCTQTIASLNAISDGKGASLKDNVVKTTPGFKGAYDQYVSGGWNALSFPEEIGGAGLPATLSAVFIDALNAACLSFAVGTTLTIGAAKAVKTVGTDEQKKLYLEKMVAGEWTGSMNLTEPQAGSDLAAIKTKAVPVGDGTYKITGQKIFITYGEHDLTDNIIHLVLARLPDAPAGAAGISMFLVPKFHVNADGSLGERNDVYCVGLEEKLGIHGSPTCVMAFGDNNACIGTLLGEENKGLRNMFIMMNAARLDVGLQGVGVSERAFQLASAYARERRQGRAPENKSGVMVPIYDHPDVRRMLYSMKALTDASRAICYANAVAYDLARHAPHDETRRKMSALEGLLTPISKAWSTDRANEITSLGVQVHGGMGYIEETGAAQLMRDARIAAIYEGTNGIQAIDLVGRKLQGDAGETALGFIHQMKEEAAHTLRSNDETIIHIGQRLQEAILALHSSTQWLLNAAKNNMDDVLAGATPYLKQFGNVVGGYYLLKGALAAQTDHSSENHDAEYLSSKINIASFYADNYLSEAVGLTSAVTAGAQTLKPLTQYP